MEWLTDLGIGMLSAIQPAVFVAALLGVIIGVIIIALIVAPVFFKDDIAVYRDGADFLRIEIFSLAYDLLSVHNLSLAPPVYYFESDIQRHKYDIYGYHRHAYGGSNEIAFKRVDKTFHINSAEQLRKT